MKRFLSSSAIAPTLVLQSAIAQNPAVILRSQGTPGLWMQSLATDHGTRESFI